MGGGRGNGAGERGKGVSLGIIMCGEEGMGMGVGERGVGLGRREWFWERGEGVRLGMGELGW